MEIILFRVRIISKILLQLKASNLKNFNLGFPFLTNQQALETEKWLYSASQFYKLLQNMLSSV